VTGGRVSCCVNTIAGASEVHKKGNIDLTSYDL